MKKLTIFLACVIFVLPIFSIPCTYAFSNEVLEFVYEDKIFTYSLSSNIKSSSVFDIDHRINKHNRFGSKKDRQKLLSHMLKLNFEKHVVLEYLFPNLSVTFAKIKKVIELKPQNAKLSIKPSTEKVFFTTPEKIGIRVDQSSLFEKIIYSYLNNKTLSFTVPTSTISPQVKMEDFKHIFLRGDFSTDISKSTPDRKHNVKNALASLNKIEIMPNQTFSFNQTIGRRTEENGYRNAKIIVNNEFVDGLGGGVCQVSSTLYNTALLSGLEIVEANKHSKQVSYVKYGFDAMVNYGSSDLKFRNNTNQKLTIITNYSPTTARIRIFGENLHGMKYVLSNQIINSIEPTEEIIYDENCEYLDKVQYEDEYFYLKKPSRGMEIKSFRECYQNNKLVYKKLLRHDKFKVQNAVKVFGTKKHVEDSTHCFENI